MPEEHNRVLTDHCSSLLFCPTSTAMDNLQAENIKQNVHFVGDTMYDAVLAFTPHALHKSKIVNELNLKTEKFILATIHRPYNTDEREVLERLLKALSKLEFKVLLPIHPRLESRLLQFSLMLPSNVVGLPPLGYFDMLSLQKMSSVIITDSGGLQKKLFFMLLHV